MKKLVIILIAAFSVSGIAYAQESGIPYEFLFSQISAPDDEMVISGYGTGLYVFDEADGYTTVVGSFEVPLIDGEIGTIGANAGNYKFILYRNAEDLCFPYEEFSFDLCLSQFSSSILATGSFTHDDTPDPHFTNFDVVSNFSSTLLSGAFLARATEISGVAAYAILAVLAFVGLLIAAGYGWRFLTRHVGVPIGAMKQQARRKYLSDTDDRSERGDFLIGGK